MKKIKYFFALSLSVVGGIGSLGFMVWQKEWVIAIGLIVLCYAAFPTIKNWKDKLINE